MGTMEMSVEQFLNHEGRARFASSYLKNWKGPRPNSKQQPGPGHATVWLHRKCAFSVAIWRHGVPREDVVEDKENGGASKRIIVFDKLLCPESEDTLQKQGWHDRDTGEPDMPPECCPIHKLREWCWQMIRAGELDLVKEIFRFEDGAGRIKILHAGGVCGMFNDKLSDADKAKLKKAGIYLSEAWGEDLKAKLEYVFRVVDNGQPSAGVQIAVEPALIGQKMQMEIRRAMMPGVWGPQRGNPVLNPYAFRWEDHPEQMEFSKKYDAIRQESIQATPEIMKLITETEPPSIDGLTRAPQWPSVRANLERAALIDLPWDDFFGTEVTNEDKKESSRARTPEIETTRHEVPIPKGSTLGREITKMMQASEVERFACDNAPTCDAVLLATDAVCPKCGLKYDVQPAAPPPPPELPKRSSAMKPSPSGGGATKPTPVPEAWMNDPSGSDDIPF